MKMGLFLVVLIFEIQPMVTFIRWRLAKERAGELVASAPLDRFVALNDAEAALVLVIPFAAALMRGGRGCTEQHSLADETCETPATVSMVCRGRFAHESRISLHGGITVRRSCRSLSVAS